MVAGARIIDGKARAARLRREIASEVAVLRGRHGVAPCLAAVLVGDDPASAIYVTRKIEQTRDVGMHSLCHRLPAATTQAELLALIAELNADADVHGILVQLPLPAHVDEAEVLTAIDPDKDVDGFHVVNVGRLATGMPTFAPCTPLGCMILLEEAVEDLRGKRALVIGCSNIVGRPMAQLLLQADCTVMIAHRHTVDVPALCAQADIVVVATGVPGLIRGAWLKPGAVVIDVGINRVERDGKSRIVGDVVFHEAVQVAGAITPVPGGVGPMTIACLLRNTLTAATRLHGLDLAELGAAA